MRKVLILSASFLILLFSCKKEGVLSPDFAENSSFSFFTDEVEIQSRTVKADTILTSNLSNAIIGEYQDSIFGKTTASAYFQVLLSSNALRFFEDGQIPSTDSVVLSLEYDGSYGDLNLAQTFEVFRLTEDLDSETDYYSNASVMSESSPLASHQFIPNLDSNVNIRQPNSFGSIDTLELRPQLRIRLDKSLGDEILSKSDQSEVSDNDNFTNFFKGFKVTVLPSSNSFNTNALLYFALTASNSKMTIYYHADTIPKSVDFPINSSSVRFTQFQHDYTNSIVETSLGKTNDTLFSYLMSMGSVETVLSFSDLSNVITDPNTLINKAELVLPAAEGDFLVDGFASSLLLVKKNESGQLEFISDFFEGLSFFGGELNNLSEDYKFNITRYVQSIVNGSNDDDELYIVVTERATSGQRAVLYGTKNPSRNIKLNLYYSKTQ